MTTHLSTPEGSSTFSSATITHATPDTFSLPPASSVGLHGAPPGGLLPRALLSYITSSLPAVVVLFLPFSSTATDGPDVVASVQSVLDAAGVATKMAVVLLQAPEGGGDSDKDALAAFRSASGLPSKRIFVLPPESDNATALGKLGKALADLATTYYQDEARRVRRDKEALDKRTQQDAIVRAYVCMGLLRELQGEVAGVPPGSSALKYYKSAYSFSKEVTVDTADAALELLAVCELLHFKILMCLLRSGATDEASAQFRGHMAYFGGECARAWARAPEAAQGLEYMFHAWIARQYDVLAALEEIFSWAPDVLTQGYCYERAGFATLDRARSFSGTYNAPDSSSSSSTTDPQNGRGKVESCLFHPDTDFIGQPPSWEHIGALEAETDVYTSAIEYLTRAHKYYAAHLGAPQRKLIDIGSKLGDAYAEFGDAPKALAIYQRLHRTILDEGWADLGVRMLDKMVRVASQAADAPALITHALRLATIPDVGPGVDPQVFGEAMTRLHGAIGLASAPDLDLLTCLSAGLAPDHPVVIDLVETDLAPFVWGGTWDGATQGQLKVEIGTSLVLNLGLRASTRSALLAHSVIISFAPDSGLDDVLVPIPDNRVGVDGMLTLTVPDLVVDVSGTFGVAALTLVMAGESGLLHLVSRELQLGKHVPVVTVKPPVTVTVQAPSVTHAPPALINADYSVVLSPDPALLLDATVLNQDELDAQGVQLVIVSETLIRVEDVRDHPDPGVSVRSGEIAVRVEGLVFTIPYSIPFAPHWEIGDPWVWLGLESAIGASKVVHLIGVDVCGTPWVGQGAHDDDNDQEGLGEGEVWGWVGRLWKDRDEQSSGVAIVKWREDSSRDGQVVETVFALPDVDDADESEASAGLSATIDFPSRVIMGHPFVAKLTLKSTRQGGSHTRVRVEVGLGKGVFVYTGVRKHDVVLDGLSGDVVLEWVCVGVCEGVGLSFLDVDVDVQDGVGIDVDGLHHTIDIVRSAPPLL